MFIMIPCNIIITKCHDGTPLPHIKIMGHNLKYTTHISFIHTIHTTLRYIADFSYLKPIPCMKR